MPEPGPRFPAPLALRGLARGSRSAVCCLHPQPGGPSARNARGAGGCAEGRPARRAPPRPSAGAARHGPQAAPTRAGHSVPPHPTRLTLQGEAAGQGCRRPGAKPAGAPAPRSARRAPAAVLPRRRSLGPAETGGRGAGRAGAGATRCPGAGGRRVRSAARNPRRPGPAPGDCAERPRGRGRLLLPPAARMRGGRAAPEPAEEGAARGEAGGSGPGRGQEQERSPYLWGWADSSRAPSRGGRDRKITTRGGPGRGGGWLQDKVGGSSCTAKKTLPSRPVWLEKCRGESEGQAAGLPCPAGLAAEVNTFAGRCGDSCDTRRGLL